MKEQQSKWQPVMLVMSKRLECHCGALAIFVVLDLAEEEEEDGYKEFDYGAFCQSCWQKEEED